MPDYLRSGSRYFWGYQWRVLRRAGWPAFGRDALVGLLVWLVTGARLGEWSELEPILVGVVIGSLVYAIDLARASAMLDKEASERVQLLMGGFSEEEISKRDEDRLRLYKAAIELYNAWVRLWNRATRGSGSEMDRALSAVQARFNELQQLVPTSDIEAVAVYHRWLGVIDDILLSDDDAFKKAGKLEDPLLEILGAARQSEWWDIRRRGYDPVSKEPLPPVMPRDSEN